MNDLVFIPSNTLPKVNVDPLRSDWNEFQHLSTQGRYITPRTFAEFRAPRYKLASVKKQIYNPIVPTIRHIERDEVLCRLPDEHCRHTSSFTEEQFQNFDPTRSNTFVDFTGLNWNDSGKALMGSNDPSSLQSASTPAFGHRLRPDKSQTDTRSAQNQIYRTPTFSSSSFSSTTKTPVKYSFRNYGLGVYDQTPKSTMWPRYHMNTKNTFDSINRLPLPSQMQGIFRSATMYNGISNAPWK
ncbi:hypothetical protein I4U23_006930 [Adineta vaga]|nr:hypothetical protein I4U23_006930 [Adineta vaga]